MTLDRMRRLKVRMQLFSFEDIVDHYIPEELGEYKSDPTSCSVGPKTEVENVNNFQITSKEKGVPWRSHRYQFIHIHDKQLFSETGLPISRSHHPGRVQLLPALTVGTSGGKKDTEITRYAKQLFLPQGRTICLYSSFDSIFTPDR